MGSPSGIELELKEMIVLISRQHELISSLGEKGAQLDERKESLSKEVEHLRHSLRDTSSELVKANDLIQRLQDEGSLLSRRLQTQENLLASQEAQMKTKDERLNQTSCAFNAASDRVAKLEAEMNQTMINRMDVEEKLKSLEDASLTKENMIAYLSKQIIDYDGTSKQRTEETQTLMELKTKLEADVGELKSRNTELHNRLNESEALLTTNCNLVTHLNKQQSDSEGLCKLMSHEIQGLRKNNAKLDFDYHEKQKALQAVLEKLTGLEAELKEKSALILRQQDLISSLGEKGVQVEEKKEQLNQDVGYLKQHCQGMSAELTKANEIIRKLQEEGRQCSRRLNTQEATLKSQEVELKSKSEGLIQSSSALRSATEQLGKLEAEAVSIKSRRDELEKLLKTAEETMSSKENMITYLSKQLSDYEGMLNLDKFRQTVSQNNTYTPNESASIGVKTGNATQPSWRNIYNSTLRTTGMTNQSAPRAVTISEDEQGSGDKSRSHHVTPTGGTMGRHPSWARSNKATLDNLQRKSK